jgi:peptidoglycan/LPS O-acetylase OafA/YrhL
MKDLEARIEAIEARNRKVEQDKAWEVSWTRRVSIGALTYAVIVVYLFVINNSNPWVNAAVPVVGFVLSTLALSWVKTIWQKSD